MTIPRLLAYRRRAPLAVPTPIHPSLHPRLARPLTAALLAVASIAVAPSLARAESAARPSSLSWVRLPGAEACIGSRALATAVERRLQREVFVPPSRAAVAVEGRIEPSSKPPGFRAVITISDEAGVELGNREIHGASPTCAAMNDDLALVIAVMIDPDAALSPALPAPPSPPPSPAVPAPPPPAPPAPPPPQCAELPPAPPPPPAWHVSLQAGGVAMLGLLPQVSGGVLLRSHVVPPHFWTFEVGGILFPAVASAQNDLGVSLQLAEAFVNLCPFTLDAFGTAISACAGLQAGAIHAIGLDSAAGTVQEQGVFNVALEGRVHRRLVGPLVLGAGLGLTVPVVRASFSYGGQEIFTMAPIAGAVDLSLGVEFP